jgi:hypothetical protein
MSMHAAISPGTNATTYKMEAQERPCTLAELSL